MYVYESFDENCSFNSSSRMMWRILNGIGCLFFLFAALVNLNDSDWYLWVAIYLTTSVFLGIELFNYRSLSSVIVYMNGFAFCMFLSFGCHFLFKYQQESRFNSLDAHFLRQEQGRELSGLALASAWLFLILLNRIIYFNSRLFLVVISLGLFLSIVPVGMWSVCFVSDDWRQRFPQCQTMVTVEQRYSSFHPTF